ncbi:MAG: heavy metal-associated domain-containing protein [Lachnospiraceae bacterium]|jgi:copper chaperone CopZ|nr:heavy-metal-associated domain-containing protein [Lachnospiraceae bacterium]MBR6397663.1 heavy-metal-associated domain-containing protein [Lachnospiraceae bacterium]MBR7016809.1 heavy-metal-associated domain-containing protein [Lachnospiraceae bacterium]MEE3437852.1 heavy metal-associated domain-containing protein [Lachnospiraceae bacterium]
MTRTIIGVDGMMCSMCEAHINEAVRKAVPEAKKITSNRGKKQTEIISEEPVDTEKIKAAIEATGYTYLGAESEPYKKKGFLFF